jgi:hypothetical protein
MWRGKGDNKQDIRRNERRGAAVNYGIQPPGRRNIMDQALPLSLCLPEYATIRPVFHDD